MQGGAVSLANLEGKTLRRSVLRGAVVVFVTAGYSGKRFIFERCKQLGLRSVVIDGPDSWSASLVADGLIEKFVAVDFMDTATIFDRVLAACIKVCPPARIPQTRGAAPVPTVLAWAHAPR